MAISIYFQKTNNSNSSNVILATRINVYHDFIPRLFIKGIPWLFIIIAPYQKILSSLQEVDKNHLNLKIL